MAVVTAFCGFRFRMAVFSVSQLLESVCQLDLYELFIKMLLLGRKLVGFKHRLYYNYGHGVSMRASVQHVR
jgi:hypothetical protein